MPKLLATIDQTTRSTFEIDIEEWEDPVKAALAYYADNAGEIDNWEQEDAQVMRLTIDGKEVIS